MSQPGQYQQVQFSTLVTSLATRLADPNQVFWTSSELQSYLIEALRTWQSFSAFWSTKVSFGTSPSVLFYNLSSIVPELTPSITDRQLIVDIQIALQEPPNGSSWVGTEQYNLSGVASAIQRRRDRFKVEAGIGYTISEVGMPPAPSGNLELDDKIIDVRRVMWKDSDGRYTLLWKADQFTMTAGSPGWFSNPGFPTDYSTVLQQPLMMRISPPPADNGSVHLITLNTGATLNPASSATILGIPDDLCWVIKFGALADLYTQDGPGQDPERAAYCEERWRDGIALARITNYVKLGYQDGVPSFVDSMEELDQANPSWVNQLPGPPQSLMVLGNIAAVAPIPDDGPHGIAFDIMPRFPVPVLLTDYVQIGQEYLDTILDYAQHLANVKIGSTEIKDSYELYKNFASLAAVVNDRLRAGAQNFDVLSDRSRLTEKINPRRKSDISLKELDYAQS